MQDIKKEFDVNAKKPMDVGTLALGVSSAVGIVIVGVIFGCHWMNTLFELVDPR